MCVPHVHKHANPLSSVMDAMRVSTFFIPYILELRGLLWEGKRAQLKKPPCFEKAESTLYQKPPLRLSW